MTDRQKVSSGVKFEGIVGYSRAVKIGTLVFVSGTTGVDYAANSDSDLDAYSQTKRAIENINSALARVGSSPLRRCEDPGLHQTRCRLA